MRLIDADEVVKFYKNMGKEFPELSVGIHFSISDIISNLDNIPTVKEEHINALDNAERRYLSGFIRPFRSEIKNIEKRRNADNSLDRIIFNMKDHEMFFLPLFKAETMHIGMSMQGAKQWN